MSHQRTDVAGTHSGQDLRKKVLMRAKLMVPIWHKQASGRTSSHKPDTVCTHTEGPIQSLALYPVVTRQHNLPDSHDISSRLHLPAVAIKHTMIDPAKSLDYTLVYVSPSCDFFVTDECRCDVTVEHTAPKRRFGMFNTAQADDVYVQVTHLRTHYRRVSISDIDDATVTDINTAFDKVRRRIPNSSLHRRMADIYQAAGK